MRAYYKTFVECATNSCVAATHTHSHGTCASAAGCSLVCHIHTYTLNLASGPAFCVCCVCVVSYFLWIGCNSRKHQQDAILMSQAISRMQPEILRHNHEPDSVIQLPMWHEFNSEIDSLPRKCISMHRYRSHAKWHRSNLATLSVRWTWGTT